MKNPTVVFTAVRSVTIEDRPMPEVGPQELLIETKRSLISTGTELTMLSGEYPPGSTWDEVSRFPLAPGYSNAGVVVGVGSAVDRNWLGRRVASTGVHAKYVKGTLGARPIPEAVDDESATFFAVAEVVMNGVRRSGITWGESVVIFGAGILGQLAARVCQLAGASVVVVADVADERLGRLPAATGIVPANSTREDVLAALARVNGGRKADCVIELTGNAQLIPTEVAALRPQGRFLILSSPRGKSTFDFHDLCVCPSITIIGAHGQSHPKSETPQTPWTRNRHTELFFNWIASGQIDMTPLITHRRPFTDAAALYEMLLRDRSQAMGVVLDWS